MSKSTIFHSAGTRSAAARLVLAAIALLSGAAAAEPATGLTLAGAIRLAIRNNPDSRSAAEDIAAARGAYRQARVLPNPSIFIYRLGAAISPADVPYPNQYGLTWTIHVGGQRAAAMRVARAGIGAAQANLTTAHRQLALAVETAFIGVLLDQSLLDFARQDQQAFQQSVQINELRYKDGKIAYGDVLKLRIQQRAVDDTVRQAVQALVNDRAELARLIGSGAGSPEAQVMGALSAPAAPPVLDVDQVIAAALSNRPELRSLRAQREGAVASISAARRQAIPDIGVLADYDYLPGTAGQYDYELTATVPLFDWNQGNVDQAKAAAAKAQLAIDSLRNQLRADATRAVQAWRTAEERLRAYSEDFVKSAQQSLDIARRSYQEGRGTLLDYLDAESSYRDVQRAYRSAQADAQLAAANLKFVSGEELP